TLKIFFVFYAHIEEKLQSALLFFEQMGGHLPVSQVRHEKDRPLPVYHLFQLLPVVRGKPCFPLMNGEKTVKMNSGKALILAKGTPEVIQGSFLRIEQGVKATALRDVF
ncbi:MAG: hypothetical protein Q7V20_16685, partial [Aquabacterium sp.]|uniref:hypothetical protein n=1 Tax=Aquabacterium sp. TaxID=1872578 RepID=UPI002722F275